MIRIHVCVLKKFLFSHADLHLNLPKLDSYKSSVINENHISTRAFAAGVTSDHGNVSYTRFDALTLL